MINKKAFDFVKELGIGWNVGNSFDAVKKHSTGNDGLGSETAWKNPPVSKELIDSVCREGFDVIRIPVTWSNHFVDDNCTIDSEWLERVAEVVDYTYNKGVRVILNTHHENWIFISDENYPRASKEIKRIWEKLCERFKDYGERLIFEGMNEPRKMGCPDEWNGGDAEARNVVNKLNLDFVDTVRSFGGNNAERYLMIATYCGCCTDTVMRELEIPDDNGIIVTVHSYKPWGFACSEPDKPDYTAVFDMNDPEFMESLDETFGFMKKYCIDKNIPVIIGEFGALNKDNDNERLKYIGYMRKKADETGVKLIWWDNGYPHDFALFDRKSSKVIHQQLIDALTK